MQRVLAKRSLSPGRLPPSALAAATVDDPDVMMALRRFESVSSFAARAVPVEAFPPSIFIAMRRFHVPPFSFLSLIAVPPRVQDGERGGREHTAVQCGPFVRVLYARPNLNGQKCP